MAPCAAEGRPDPALSLDQSARPTCVRFDQLGQSFGERAPGAGRVAAVKPPRPQLDAHGTSERGKIGRAPLVLAVHVPARASTVRAMATGSRAVCADVEEG